MIEARMGSKVLFIGGSGRSGTTLLARVIGQIPGFWTVGEVRELWRDRVGQNRLCGCGQVFAACPFWERVGAEAFGGWSNVDRAPVEGMVGSLSWAGVFRALRPGATEPLGSPELGDVLSRLYSAISAAAGGATIVDTSKGPPYGVALSAVPGIDFRAVHIVRDSRGVANSWLKEIPRPMTPSRVLRGHKLSAVASTRWWVHNMEMELLGRRVPMARIRYESFAEDPAAETLRVLRELDQPVDPAALEFLEGGSAELQTNHTVAGNPNRLETGSVRVRVDTAWRQDLTALQRLQVAAMTWPMLVRYGFEL
jgi:hypothetical protein